MFESQEEFTYVSSFLSNNNMQDNIFFIGGRRNLDSQDYYWIDQNNNLTGNVLNTPDAFSKRVIDVQGAEAEIEWKKSSEVVVY